MASGRSSSRFPLTRPQLTQRLIEAATLYWENRTNQATRQRESGINDAGMRSEVTGGKHLDGFCQLICEIIYHAGFSEEDVRIRTGVDLPGYYRPTKKWDIIVTSNGTLCAVIEMKSQVGPSFGNNFNNRTEEAIGSSVDFWTAFREGVIGNRRPWLGYFFLLEDSPKSRQPISLASSTFEPMDIFHNTSYADRYAILCRRLLLERNYDGTTLLLTSRQEEIPYSEPYKDLVFELWAKALYGHLIGCL